MTRKWRDDGQCGKYYPLPDGTPSECDPHGELPCCNGVRCGNTQLDCNCWGCVDYQYNRVTKKWRDDRRCGKYHPLPDGKPAQCDPDGYSLCCYAHLDGAWDDWCIDNNSTSVAEDCYEYFVDYSVTNIKKWRDDGRCGVSYPLPDGYPSQCNPFGIYPCCNDKNGRCGNKPKHCTCKNCVDFRLILKRRKDKMCENASVYPLWDDTLSLTDEYTKNGQSNLAPIITVSPYISPITAESNFTNLNSNPRRITESNLNSNPRNTESNLNSNKSKHWKYEDNIFKCDNDRCVNYKQLCNGIDDCGDLSDELDCPQHMICKSTINSIYPKFIHPRFKCDGEIDCFDWSDECNDSCGREILGSWILKMTCCFMGIFAMVFNSVSLFHGVSSIIHDCSTENMLITKVLMCLIGSGDFLIGVYLIALFIYDSLVHTEAHIVSINRSG